MAKINFPKKQEQRLIPKYLLDYAEALQENHPDPSASWGGGSGGDYTAGNGIDIENNVISVDDTVALKEDIITSYDDLSDKPDLSVYELKTDAFSGDYNDLTNKPTIPDAVSGTNDGTNWTSLTIGSETHGLASGSAPSNMMTTDTVQDITADKKFTNNHKLTFTDTNTLGSSAQIDNYKIGTYHKTNGVADGKAVILDGNENYLEVKDTTQAVHVTQEKIAYTNTNTSLNKDYALSGSHRIATLDDMPTKTSDLTNDSGFVTSSALADYERKLTIISTNVSSGTLDATTLAYLNASPSAYAFKYYSVLLVLANILDGSYYYRGLENDSANNRILGYRLQLNKITGAWTIDAEYINRLVSGTNDGFNWTSLTIGSVTKSIPSGGSSYTAGTGIDITNNTISIDNTVALKTDIPTVPTNISSFTNDAGYITSSALPDMSNYYTKTEINTNYYDRTDVDDIVDNVAADIPEIFANQPNPTTALTSLSINNTNYSIPTIPTNVSAFTNDAGYITNTVNNLTNYTLSSNLATVATSGSYNDLSNKPNIPTYTTIFTDTPTSGTTLISTITLSDAITNYDEIIIYYNGQDSTEQKFSYQASNPAVGDQYNIHTVGHGTARMYYRNTLFEVTNSTTLTMNSSTQARVGNNEATQFLYSTTETRCRPYKIVGIKY